mmetsp:Transcript_21903/g.24748  ORF Transcript_21903/g.24748 Transcript_21903/m.24748 type:complete len:127 (+) Transcript_21903:61-441(+)
MEVTFYDIGDEVLKADGFTGSEIFRISILIEAILIIQFCLIAIFGCENSWNEGIQKIKVSTALVLEVVFGALQLFIQAFVVVSVEDISTFQLSIVLTFFAQILLAYLNLSSKQTSTNPTEYAYHIF